MSRGSKVLRRLTTVSGHVIRVTSPRSFMQVCFVSPVSRSQAQAKPYRCSSQIDCLATITAHTVRNKHKGREEGHDLLWIWVRPCAF